MTKEIFVAIDSDTIFGVVVNETDVESTIKQLLSEGKIVLCVQ